MRNFIRGVIKWTVYILIKLVSCAVAAIPAYLLYDGIIAYNFNLPTFGYLGALWALTSIIALKELFYFKVKVTI